MYMGYKIAFCIALLLNGAILWGQRELVACGDDKVVIIDGKNPASGDARILWEWKASEAADLSADYKKRLRTMDECKPLDKGNKLLVTSSGGAVLLLDVKTKKVLFYAAVPNAHSAELLPGNLVVVALSTHPQGNSLELYAVGQPEKRRWKDSLYSGHGVVWNKSRQRLYALGFDVLRSYRLTDTRGQQPVLVLENSWKLPDEGGHDLLAIDDGELLVSTHHNVFRFNLQTQQFSVFDLLKGKQDIKSANYNKKTGQLVYTQAEENWWTFNIYTQNPAGKIHIPDIRLYKARVLRW